MPKRLNTETELMQNTHSAQTEIEPEAWRRIYDKNMQLFRNDYQVIAHINSPIVGLELEIRRFYWDKRPPPLAIALDLCYLSLAITPRPSDMKVDFVGGLQQASYTPYGNCCFVPAGQLTYNHGCIGEYQEICCMFDPRLFDRFRDWDWTPLELAACFNIKNINIQNYLLRLAEEASHSGYGSSLLVESTFNALCIELSRHFRAMRSANDNTAGTLSPHHMRIVNDKIKHCLNQDLSVESLAKLCGMSARHLSRVFKKTTGFTLGKHIANERINQARLLLSQSDILVKEIAYSCGFKSQSSFSQAFLDATDQTPSQFRTQSRNLKSLNSRH